MNESTSKLLDRRQFLRLSAMAAAGTVVAACSSGGGSSSGSSSGAINGQFRITKTDIEYAQDIPFNGTLKEAPTLAALVKQGKLPPVDQRVPKPPYVMP
ncbi:MAG: twin-arginine translocation signal domain-containing protein, partial [Candidatus Dormiibacterota bacterium]